LVAHEENVRVGKDEGFAKAGGLSRLPLEAGESGTATFNVR
uniref:Beta-glucosidase 1 (Fragments) n=1 Tax=Passalora fulva TaxID=5499 RepID=BGL1_PASFU|nr:RecName: Full=Beta-glucosidase 1; AltName: Full=Beta-D-glucoside glucohydrolase; AltName: Full=Cellobiase; AltName: Full=Gentiobiase [Fulvia fulva]